ncbi:ATP-binding protein [Nanoarchaeota archaeon NZ13-N]|uniref:Uncharacterized protein n=1 Tax=Candidatus Nanoclepta minutus TaxID=1940235 RepID=A0A397WPL9_9ARCH|nr:MAG: ATP-binding protein [Nanoarchaeota archaeon NZ13-N]RIB35449.1 MAG: hypothetical protein BXU00_01645 [Candidatus Nanoclepta minutus]
MKIGFVIKEATSDYFYFVINPKERDKITVGSLVKIIINDVPYYAIVEDIKSEAIEEDRLINFEAIEIVYDKIGKKLFILRGKGIFIGCLRDNKVLPEKPKTPPLPGDDVLLAEYEEIKKIYSFETDYTIPFGKIFVSDKEYTVDLSIKNLIIRHTGIFGITGSGKSTAVANLVYELSKKNIPTLIFDIHRDYILSFQNPIIITFSERDREYIESLLKERGKNGRVYTAKLDIKILNDYMEILGINRESMPHVANLLSELLSKARINTIFDLLKFLDERKNVENLIKNYGDKEIDRLANSLKSRIKKIYDWRLFPRDARDFGEDLRSLLDNLIRKITDMEGILEGEIVRNGDEISIRRENTEYRNIIIIDLYPLSIEEQRILIDILLERLYNKYKELKFEGKADILTIVIEEAHRFVSREAKDTSAKVSLIAREGRKFGLGIILVSQIPSSILDSVISQLNTFILLKMINPRDLEFIKKTCPYLSKEYFEALTKLETGKALVVGLAPKNPAIVKIIKNVDVGGTEEDIERSIEKRVKLLREN